MVFLILICTVAVVHIDESLAYEDMFDDLFLQKDWTPILNDRLYHRFSPEDCVVFQTH